MTSSDIDSVLDRAEREVSYGQGLKGTGFWPVVERLKRDRALAAQYAERVAKIDRTAFERGVRLRVGIKLGGAILAAVSLAGVVLCWLAVAAGSMTGGNRVVLLRYANSWIVVAMFLAGVVALIAGTHSLAHLIVGRLVGIDFTHAFIAGRPPEPGVKIEYTTYLRATPIARAVMHASGAVVTKIIPFALLPFVSSSLRDDAPWLMWFMVGLGVLLLATDVFLSTRVSDWMKVRRELSARKG